MNMQGEHLNQNQSRRNRIVLALFIVITGAMFLLKAMALPFFPSWLFTWPVVLIGIGLYIGISRGFRETSWLVFFIIGSFFLADDIIPGISLHRFIWPIIIISIGLLLLLSPRRRFRKRYQWGDRWNSDAFKQEPQYVSDDVIDISSVFGGAHKTIVSKHFRGGEIVNFMGGADINFLQADIDGFVVLEITQVMGGIKLTIPPTWHVQNEITSVFASVDDRRPHGTVANAGKVLILKGSSVFAGIDIR